jgi:hypothetical protein
MPRDGSAWPAPRWVRRRAQVRGAGNRRTRRRPSGAADRAAGISGKRAPTKGPGPSLRTAGSESPGASSRSLFPYSLIRAPISPTQTAIPSTSSSNSKWCISGAACEQDPRHQGRRRGPWLGSIPRPQGGGATLPARARLLPEFRGRGKRGARADQQPQYLSLPSLHHRCEAHRPHWDQGRRVEPVRCRLVGDQPE